MLSRAPVPSSLSPPLVDADPVPSFAQAPLAPTSPTRKSIRVRAPSSKFIDFIPIHMVEHFIGMTEEGGEPLRFTDACQDRRWLQAMVKEFNSIMKNLTWELVQPPVGIKPITSKWIYKIKPGSNPSSPPVYKAHIVELGNE